MRESAYAHNSKKADAHLLSMFDLAPLAVCVQSFYIAGEYDAKYFVRYYR